MNVEKALLFEIPSDHTREDDKKNWEGQIFLKGIYSTEILLYILTAHLNNTVYLI